MTAEVAIANKTAVALAADSAVSIGPSADKIYSSALKLFQLVDRAPVGIMVSGAADFLGIPWETIIKTYRKERGIETFPNLVNYRDDFLEFVSSHEQLFPSELQIQYVERLITSYFMYLLKLVRAEGDNRIKQGDRVTENDLTDIVHDVVSKEQVRVSKEGRLDGFTEDVVRGIRRSTVRKINRIKERIFSALPHSKSTSRKITDLAFGILTRNDMRSMRTGLVFAGFGNDEFLPRLYSVNVEIMVNDHIRCKKGIHYEADRKPVAAIIPFAQTDMVHTFMQGIHPSIDWNRYITVSTVMEKFVDRISTITEEYNSQLAVSLRASFTECVQSILHEIKSEWQSQTDHRSTPIVMNVSVLPMDELGAMAESLVNLTKFRLRVSPERETVSGPIDVAVISKGDGFVWLKRKHYFQPELNPRILARYDRRD